MSLVWGSSVDNGVFGTHLTFKQFIATLIILIAGSVVIKVTFSFDLNKYMESRLKVYAAKCKNACLHFQFVKDGDQIGAQSFFVSPAGTLSYICQRCSSVRLNVDEDEMVRTYNYYADHLEEYAKQNKKFSKYLKKSGNA